MELLKKLQEVRDREIDVNEKLTLKFLLKDWANHAYKNSILSKNDVDDCLSHYEIFFEAFLQNTAEPEVAQYSEDYLFEFTEWVEHWIKWLGTELETKIKTAEIYAYSHDWIEQQYKNSKKNLEYAEMKLQRAEKRHQLIANNLRIARKLVGRRNESAVPNLEDQRKLRDIIQKIRYEVNEIGNLEYD